MDEEGYRPELRLGNINRGRCQGGRRAEALDLVDERDDDRLLHHARLLFGFFRSAWIQKRIGEDEGISGHCARSIARRMAATTAPLLGHHHEREETIASRETDERAFQTHGPIARYFLAGPGHG